MSASLAYTHTTAEGTPLTANTKAGPDMTVRSVSVNGKAAQFAFVQPTYPGYYYYWQR